MVRLQYHRCQAPSSSSSSSSGASASLCPSSHSLSRMTEKDEVCVVLELLVGQAVPYLPNERVGLAQFFHLSRLQVDARHLRLLCQKAREAPLSFARLNAALSARVLNFNGFNVALGSLVRTRPA